MSTSTRDRTTWRRRHPEALADALQLVRIVVATVAAWWVATALLGSQMPFLAPWNAMMSVHATVYRTVHRGLQSLAVTLIGVGLAFAIGYPLGVTLPSMVLAMALGVAASRIPRLRDEGINIAATMLFVLTANDQYDLPMLGDRVLEVCIGVGIGTLVTIVVAPPLFVREAENVVDDIHTRMGHLLLDMAAELAEPWDADESRAWVARTEEMDDTLEHAWAQVRRARESARWNPRSRAAGGAPVAAVLTRLHEGVSHLRHLVRTLEEAPLSEREWDPGFRRRWIELVDDTGRRLATPDADLIPDIDEALDDLVTATRPESLSGAHWPLYGALITSLRYIAHIADDVSDPEELLQTQEREAQERADREGDAR